MEVYKLNLNGKFYGTGNLAYMKELIVDYLFVHRMYGREEVDFRVVKCNEKEVDMFFNE